MDGERFSAIPGIRARPLQGVLGALVRHAQGAARRQLCRQPAHGARALPQLLHAGAQRPLRRLSHLRAMSVLRSRDNPRLKRWARLSRDAAFRKKEKRTLLEGPHLVEEAVGAGLQTVAVLASESAAERPEIRKLATVVVSDSLFRLIADADSPQGV